MNSQGRKSWCWILFNSTQKEQEMEKKKRKSEIAKQVTLITSLSS